MGASNLYLVDEHGQPLPQHIIEAVERMEPGIQKLYSHYCDPAELSNSLEEGARRVAQHERQYGRLHDVGGFTWRTLSNAALSLIRFQSRQKSLISKALAGPMSGPIEGSLEAIQQGIEARETLAQLEERDRLICGWENQGLTAAEIAAALKISVQAVWKAKSRRLARLSEREHRSK